MYIRHIYFYFFAIDELDWSLFSPVHLMIIPPTQVQGEYNGLTMSIHPSVSPVHLSFHDFLCVWNMSHIVSLDFNNIWYLKNNLSQDLGWDLIIITHHSLNLKLWSGYKVFGFLCYLVGRSAVSLQKCVPNIRWIQSEIEYLTLRNWWDLS